VATRQLDESAFFVLSAKILDKVPSALLLRLQGRFPKLLSRASLFRLTCPDSPEFLDEFTPSSFASSSRGDMAFFSPYVPLSAAFPCEVRFLGSGTQMWLFFRRRLSLCLLAEARCCKETVDRARFRVVSALILPESSGTYRTG